MFTNYFIFVLFVLRDKMENIAIMAVNINNNKKYVLCESGGCGCGLAHSLQVQFKSSMRLY